MLAFAILLLAAGLLLMGRARHPKLRLRSDRVPAGIDARLVETARAARQKNNLEDIDRQISGNYADGSITPEIRGARSNSLEAQRQAMIASYQRENKLYAKRPVR